MRTVFLLVIALNLLAQSATRLDMKYAVRNTTELTNALSVVTGGDVIELGSGNYSELKLLNKSFEGGLKIVSAPGAAANLDWINIQNSTNIEFSGVSIGRPLSAGQTRLVYQNAIHGSTNIKFDKVHLHGSLDNDPNNDGHVLRVTDTVGFKFTNSKIEDAAIGIVVQGSSDVAILNNEIRNIAIDGLTFSATQRVEIGHNRFTNFFPINDTHADAIQFYTSNTDRPSRDIYIHDNHITPGSGYGIQSIFMGNENGIRYQNVTIENNMIYSNGGNRAWHGISVYKADNVTIKNNTVLSTSTDEKRHWILVQDSSGARLSDNLTDDILLNNVTSVVSKDNVELITTPEFKLQIPGLDLSSGSQSQNLYNPDVGYQPGGVAPELVPPPSGVTWSAMKVNRPTATSAPRAAEKEAGGAMPTADMLFGADSSGLIDLSHLATSTSAPSPIAPSSPTSLPSFIPAFQPEATQFEFSHGRHLLQDWWTAIP